MSNTTDMRADDPLAAAASGEYDAGAEGPASERLAIHPDEVPLVALTGIINYLRTRDRKALLASSLLACKAPEENQRQPSITASAMRRSVSNAVRIIESGPKTDTDLGFVARCYSFLHELSLTSLRAVTPDGIRKLAACQQLRALSLGGTLNLESEFQDAPTQGHLQACTGLSGLTRLELFGAAPDYDYEQDQPLPKLHLKPLAQLNQLMELRVHGLTLSRAGWAPLSQLTGLTALRLGGERIEPAAVVSGIACMRALRLLDISDTRIPLASLSLLAPVWHEVLFDGRQCRGDDDWAALTQFTNLKALELSNKYGRSGRWVIMDAAAMAASLSRLTQLTRLEIWDWRIGSDAVLPLLADLPLQEIHLSSIRLTDAGLPAFVGALRAVRHVQLSDARRSPGALRLSHHSADSWVTDAGFCAVAAELVALQLHSLDLASTSLGDAAMQVVAGLTGLTSLTLARTCIRASGIALCAQLPRLRSLDLSGLDLGEGAGEVLCALSHVTSLRLTACGSLTDDAFAHPGLHWPALAELYIYRCRSLTAGCLLAVLAAAPALRRLVAEHWHIFDSAAQTKLDSMPELVFECG